jgi:hypothetical protein
MMTKLKIYLSESVADSQSFLLFIRRHRRNRDWRLPSKHETKGWDDAQSYGI